MTSRRLLIPLLLLAVLMGCAPQAAPAVIPTVAALPTVTPVTPSATFLPPTWTPSPTPAPSCDQVILGAAQAASRVCADLQVGEACLASQLASAAPRAGAAAPVFTLPGERAPLSIVSRIATRAYDPPSFTWGMVRFQAAANPPGGTDPAQAVAGLIFGQVTLSDAENGSGPFQSLLLQTGPADSGCASAPLPGVLLQSADDRPADLALNGLAVRFQGTILARAEVGVALRVSILNGRAETSATGSRLEAPAGTELYVPLGGADGYTPSGALEIRPLDSGQTGFLPLSALPRVVGVGPAVLPTQAPITPNPVYQTAMPTPTPTLTPVEPFVGTPPAGIQTYQGKRIMPGSTVSGQVPAGGVDRWVFDPVGYGPESFDSFEVTAFGAWDPVLTIESATWGVYQADVNASEGAIEAYIASLAGSGGDWRIVIRDTEGRAGAYTLRYICQGPCQPPTQAVTGPTAAPAS